MTLKTEQLTAGELHTLICDCTGCKQSTAPAQIILEPKQSGIVQCPPSIKPSYLTALQAGWKVGPGGLAYAPGHHERDMQKLTDFFSQLDFYAPPMPEEWTPDENNAPGHAPEAGGE